MYREPERVSFGYARALVAFVITTGGALVPLYLLAITVSPARTTDGHPVMPMGQVAFAIFFAPILGVIIGYLVGRRSVRRLP
jgi:O-antigen/teichoic acid export membrane protein